MKASLALIPFVAFTASCATLNDSIKLGAGMGATTGAIATYVGHQTGGRSPEFETIAIGAGIGLGLGVLASYFTHKNLEEDRQSLLFDQTEMHFGDLPPSPFIIPKTKPTKGGR